MGTRSAITTKDNPFNPFTNFNEWFSFDVLSNYNTCSYLSRIARTSESLSDEENDAEIERAIDVMLRDDFRNIYIRVKEDSFNNNTSNSTTPEYET